MEGVLRCRRDIEEKLCVETVAGIQGHEDSPAEQQPADSQRAKTLDLSVAGREPGGRRLPAPGDGCQRHDIRDQVGQGVKGVGHERLRIEEVAARALGRRHSEIDKETDASDAHAWIPLVLRGEVGVVVMVTVGRVRVADV